MKDGNKKKLSESPFLVFLITFMALAILLTLMAAFDEKGLLPVIGIYFLYGGTIAAIIGFAFINRGGNSRRKGDDAQSKYIKDNEYFKRVRAYEKPFERIVLAIILASISIAAIGYFINKF